VNQNLGNDAINSCTKDFACSTQIVTVHDSRCGQIVYMTTISISCRDKTYKSTHNAYRRDIIAT